MTLRHVRVVVLVGLVLTAFACAPAKPAPPPAPPAPTPEPIRVGISPGTPPVAFVQGGEIAGFEADMARQLAQDLGRPLRFVVLDWENQIPALLDGKTDIIMSGMTITRTREVRIAFSEPYLKSGLMALVQREDAKRYDSARSIAERAVSLGVRKATTSERFVREHFRHARVVAYWTHRDALLDLKYNRIDVFIDDAPMIVWLASENEAEFAALETPLNEEYLGWGLRQTDAALKQSVDATLARWKQDGTLNRILRRWLPHWSDLG